MRYLVILSIGCILLAGIEAFAKPVPRYLDAVRQEISRLGFTYRCVESTGTCMISTDKGLGFAGVSPSNPANSPTVAITVDDESATISILAKNLLENMPISAQQAMELLELNHQLMISKLSLNPATGEVVLSAIVNTDSNFDRKTFRSVLKGFMQVLLESKKRFMQPSAN